MAKTYQHPNKLTFKTAPKKMFIYLVQYINDTMGMSLEDKGAYIDLLMMQCCRGHMTVQMIYNVLGINGISIWGNIRDKFVQDEEGLFYNELMEIEITRSMRYNETRRHNAVRGGKKKKPYAKPYAEPYAEQSGEPNAEPNGKSNQVKQVQAESTLQPQKFVSIPPSVKDIMVRMAEREITSFEAEEFYYFYESKGWKVGKNRMRNWDAALTTWQKRQTLRGSGVIAKPKTMLQKIYDQNHPIE